VAALATLPGLGVGTLWDNSETTYGEVAREILITHDWLVLHLNSRPWFVQPPLYFWSAAALAQVFGVSELTLRLPSALATIATSAVVAYIVALLTTPRAALLAAMILSTSLMQAVVGRLAIMDALLDLTVAVAVLAAFMALRTGNGRWWVAGCAALGLATLTKGLVAPVVVGLIVVPWAGWERRTGRALRLPPVWSRLFGVALFALIVGPWAVALYLAAGPGAFDQLIGHYTVGRYLGTIENQSGPIWYYVPVLILGLFPWFPFLIPAGIEGWRDARRAAGGQDSLARLAIVWTLIPFAFFSLAQTKLPNYIALELPAIAILIGVWFDRVGSGDRARRRVALGWSALVPAVLAGLAFALWAFSRNNRLTEDFQQIRAAFAALGLVILLGSGACFALLLRRRTAWLGPFALGSVSVLVMSIIALAEPIVEHFKPIPQLAAVIERERRPGDVIAIQGVAGGNALVYYARPRITRLGPPGEKAPPPNDPERVLCAAPRAFVITARKRPVPDPTYGRTRRQLAVSNNDVLYLFDGPTCAGRQFPKIHATKSNERHSAPFVRTRRGDTMAAAAISGIDIHTYLVKEPARAIAFWRDTMGLKVTWETEDGAEFELADGSAFGLWRMDDGTWMPGNGIMFAVADVPAAVAELRAKGVSIVAHVEETPICTMAFGEDTEGNHFILHARKA
jgi:4-amino-4-deoxy-L-arabinose transferase-like glycosyltransferase/predicted enzyme related to lactoylglutathione lyase